MCICVLIKFGELFLFSVCMWLSMTKLDELFLFSCSSGLPPLNKGGVIFKGGN